MAKDFTTREMDALLALHEAVGRLRQDGQDTSDVLCDLLGLDADDFRVLLLDSGLFLAYHQHEMGRIEVEREEITVMIAEREAEYDAEDAAAQAEMAEPSETPIPDYDEVMAKMEEDKDAYPSIKVSIQWPDGGGGESPWARDLGNGLALMDNNPLYPKYQLHDIFRFSGSYAGEVVHRPFPVKVAYIYESLEDQEQDKHRRGVLADAIKPFRAKPCFFSPGSAYVLLREGMHPMVIRDALIETGVPITEIGIQTFDAETDEYKFKPLGPQGGQPPTVSE